MSYYCRGIGQRREGCVERTCPRRDDCLRYEAFNDFIEETKNKSPQEGFSTGVWFVDIFECMDNNFEDGVFKKNGGEK